MKLNVNGLSSTNVTTKGCSEISISAHDGTTLANSHPVIVLDKITENVKLKVKYEIM